MTEEPAVVLVHGAFHGPWCFERVVSALTASGLRTTSVDLLAPGQQAPDLHSNAALVTAVLDDAPGPVVLVGHSYGGAVITEAGAHPAVAHLVYLSGLAPDADEDCGGYLFPDGGGRLPAGFALPDAPAVVDPAVAGGQFYHDCDEADAAWAVERLRPQPLAWMGQQPNQVAWRAKPSTYVVCADDRAIDPAQQRLWAARCTDTVEWPCGHSPFLTQPARVATLIADLARQVLAACRGIG
jgi:pimeloyl-ACP methyl ester carboxylesterase